MSKLVQTIKYNKSKLGLTALTTGAVSIATCVNAFAADATSVTSSMDSSFAGVKSDALSALATVAPYGIAIMSAFLVWKYGIKFFKGLSK